MITKVLVWRKSIHFWWRYARCCRSYDKLLDYRRAKKILYFRRPPLRPEAVAFATSATRLIRHWKAHPSVNPRRLSHFASKSVGGSDLQAWAAIKKVRKSRNDVSPLTQGLCYSAACDVLLYLLTYISSSKLFGSIYVTRMTIIQYISPAEMLCFVTICSLQLPGMAACRSGVAGRVAVINNVNSRMNNSRMEKLGPYRE